MKIICNAACIIFLLSGAFGDITSDPHASVAVSGIGYAVESGSWPPPGEVIVRVQQYELAQERPSNSKDAPEGFGGFNRPNQIPLEKPIVSVFRFHEQDREYVKSYEFDIKRSELAAIVIPDDKGERLAFIYIDRTHAGLRVYSEEGSVSRYWPIDTFLLQRHRVIVPETVTTVRWFGSGEFTNEGFQFFGPSQEMNLALLEESHPRIAQEIRDGFRFSLNLKSGEFQEWGIVEGEIQQ